MNHSKPTTPLRAASVRRTVVVLVIIVLVIYGGFILGGMYGTPGTVTP